MPKPRRIEILTFDDAQLLDVTGPLQVFASPISKRSRPDCHSPMRSKR